MLIEFASKKLRKQCNSLAEAQRKWGTDCGSLVLRRLDEIADSDTLDILCRVNPRCHPLKGDRAGQWAVDLKHPFRLVFEPTEHPLPEIESGGLDTERVTAVRILEVEDYHGRRAKK